MLCSKSYLGTKGTKSGIRRTVFPFGTGGKFFLVLSQIPTSEQMALVNKGTFILRINTRLWAPKARWFSAIQSKQSSSEIRFPDLIHWYKWLWFSVIFKLDAWHTFKIKFFFKYILFPQEWCGVFSPIFTANLLLELNMPFSTGNFLTFKRQKKIFRKICRIKKEKHKTFNSETNNFKWQ